MSTEILEGNKTKLYKEILALPVGSLIKIQEQRTTWYVRVEGFYDINDGSKGIHYTMLGGQGEAWTSIEHISAFAPFKSIQDMQADISNGNEFVKLV